MINFLKCEATAVIKLILDLSYQDKNKITHKQIEVDTDTVYIITVADNNFGINTILCKIKSFTISPTRDVLDYVSDNTKPFVVDTITVDCSSENKSSNKVINVCDIRSITELTDYGFEEMKREYISIFK